MEIDSGLNGHLGTMGKKNGAHGGGVGAGAARRGIVVRWGLRGVRWGGAVGVAPWVGGAPAYPTRRAALRFFGAGARALRGLGCRPMASAALGALWAFLYELTASPPAAP